MLVQAGGEVATYLKSRGPRYATVLTWEQPGAVVCDFRQPAAGASDPCQPAARASDPFLGLRPAELKAEPGDGLWLTSQLCDWMEIRSGADGCVVRLHVHSRRNEELAQPGISYPA